MSEKTGISFPRVFFFVFVFVYFIGCIAGCVGAYFLRENYAKSTRIASPSDFRTSFSRAHDSSKLSSCSRLESLRASRQKREMIKYAKTRRIASPLDFRTSFSRAHDSSKLSSCSRLESLRASRQSREKVFRVQNHWRLSTQCIRSLERE